jgi:hypothetical protein
VKSFIASVLKIVATAETAQTWELKQPLNMIGSLNGLNLWTF